MSRKSKVFIISNSKEESLDMARDFSFQLKQHDDNRNKIDVINWWDTDIFLPGNSTLGTLLDIADNK